MLSQSLKMVMFWRQLLLFTSVPALLSLPSVGGAQRLSPPLRRKQLLFAKKTEESRSETTVSSSETAREILLLSRGVTQTPTVHPVAKHSPEELANVVGYEVSKPTPPPAVFDGTYCRGSACKYRTPPAVVLPAAPTGLPGYGLEKREFCRGVSCPGAPFDLMGRPNPAALDAFVLNCGHLYNDVAGGTSSKGSSSSSSSFKSIADVKQSFLRWCEKRVGVLEVGNCPSYADVVVMAQSPFQGQPNQGGVSEICGNTFRFVEEVKVAEIDLKLVDAASPPSSSSASLLLQKSRTADVAEAPDRAVPAGAPRYDQTPPCSDSNPKLAEEDTVSPVGSQDTMYQALSGSSDGTVPPVEVKGNLYDYCKNEMSEVMMGFSQTGRATVSMTRDWCKWQGSATTWVNGDEGSDGKRGPPPRGHPDWDARRCNNMADLVAFAVRDSLDTGLAPQEVCSKVYLALKKVHRVDQLVKDAWTQNGMRRVNMGDDVHAAESEANSQALKMKQMQDYTSSLFAKLRGQKDAFDEMNGAKKELARFEKKPIIAAPPPKVPPKLPVEAPLPALPDAKKMEEELALDQPATTKPAAASQ